MAAPPKNMQRRAVLLKWAGHSEISGVDAASITGQSTSSAFQLLRSMCDEGYFDEIRRGAHVYFKATGKGIEEETIPKQRWAPCLLAQVWR